MHSLRRAALRSAISASRAVATKPQTTSFAAQWSRRADAPSVQAVASSARWLSQTSRLASDAEDAADKKTIDEAIQSASEVGSVSTVGEPSAEEVLQSEAAAPTSEEAPAVHDISNPVLTETPARRTYDNSLETPYALFIRNMVFEANESHLKEAFEKYGEVPHAVVARDSRGLSRGYGFVWFNTAEALEKAVAESNGSFWHGRRIEVAPRVKNRKAAAKQSQPTKSVFVGNIPYETSDAELNRLFRELDNVTDVRVAIDRTTGWPRGFAHADFADVESAVRAVKHLEGVTLNGRKLRLDYATASGKGGDKRTNATASPPATF